MIEFNLPNPNKFAKKFSKDKLVIIPNFLSIRLIDTWNKIAKELVMNYGIDVNQSVNEDQLHYRVVTGEIIRDKFISLFEFYSSTSMIDYMKIITNEKNIFISNNLRSAININSMGHQLKQRYPWHFDAISYTVLLFLTTTKEEDGGILEVYPNLNIKSDQPIVNDLEKVTKLQILPKAGTLVIMDGACCYHSVTPLLKIQQRLSIPMVYPTTTTHVRPSNLDSTLYE